MAASTSKSSKHQQNVSMLLDKLKELAMEAEGEDNIRLYSRVEGISFCI